MKNSKYGSSLFILTFIFSLFLTNFEKQIPERQFANLSVDDCIRNILDIIDIENGGIYSKNEVFDKKERLLDLIEKAVKVGKRPFTNSEAAVMEAEEEVFRLLKLRARPSQMKQHFYPIAYKFQKNYFQAILAEEYKKRLRILRYAVESGNGIESAIENFPDKAIKAILKKGNTSKEESLKAIDKSYDVLSKRVTNYSAKVFGNYKRFSAAIKVMQKQLDNSRDQLSQNLSYSIRDTELLEKVKKVFSDQLTNIDEKKTRTELVSQLNSVGIVDDEWIKKILDLYYVQERLVTVLNELHPKNVLSEYFEANPFFREQGHFNDQLSFKDFDEVLKKFFISNPEGEVRYLKSIFVFESMMTLINKLPDDVVYILFKKIFAKRESAPAKGSLSKFWEKVSQSVEKMDGKTVTELKKFATKTEDQKKVFKFYFTIQDFVNALEKKADVKVVYDELIQRMTIDRVDFLTTFFRNPNTHSREQVHRLFTQSITEVSDLFKKLEEAGSSFSDSVTKKAIEDYLNNDVPIPANLKNDITTEFDDNAIQNFLDFYYAKNRARELGDLPSWGAYNRVNLISGIVNVVILATNTGIAWNVIKYLKNKFMETTGLDEYQYLELELNEEDIDYDLLNKVLEEEGLLVDEANIIIDEIGESIGEVLQAKEEQYIDDSFQIKGLDSEFFEDEEVQKIYSSLDLIESDI